MVIEPRTLGNQKRFSTAEAQTFSVIFILMSGFSDMLVKFAVVSSSFVSPPNDAVIYLVI